MSLASTMESWGMSRWIGLREQPVLDANRQSNRKGLYIVGDLADAPIIKAALQQGYALGQHLAANLGQPGTDGALDVVIIGAGPAGCAVALALEASGHRYVILERDQPFHTIEAFPRGKKIYADPHEVEAPEGLWFEDAPKEELVERWQAEVAQRGLKIRTREAFADLEGEDGSFTVHAHQVLDTGEAGEPTRYDCRKVVVAVGRRGTPTRLQVPGEERESVHYQLDDPAAHAGQKVVVVGGGDSAVEAAVSLAHAGAHVELSYRKPVFARPRKANRERLDEARAQGQIRVSAPSHIVAIEPDRVRLQDAGGERDVEAEHTFVLAGTQLPFGLLDKLGVQLDRQRELSHVPWFAAFAAAVWCFYAIKTGRYDFPFTVGPLVHVKDWLTVALPWFPTVDGSTRVLTGGFWGTLVYSLLILGFGLRAYFKYDGPAQKRRYLSLIGFQWVFLFGIPELLAPMVTSVPWKFYSLSVPWPLSIWSLAHEPAAIGWMVVGALTAFVLIPLYVWRNNESFCSYMCGCGGLAETLGDMWRWKAPRGDGAKAAEWMGVLILAAAVPVTLLILNDLWQLVGFNTWMEQDVAVQTAAIEPSEVPASEGYMRIASAERTDAGLALTIEKFDWDGQWRTNGWIGAVAAGDQIIYADGQGEGRYLLPLDRIPDGVQTLTLRAESSSLSSATQFAKHWYGLMVDFLLASVVGVAFYPFLGNRVWCRFFCPLRAYMEILSKRIGRLAIVPNNKCISCGECTRYCQMGIDVQGFAQQQLHFDNANSACIQCGICVEVCPMDVLELRPKQELQLSFGQTDVIGPRWG